MENRRVVQLSNQTIVPITYVPDIILYVDGIPYMRYDGNHDIQSIKKFILDIYQQLQKTAFMDGKRGGQSKSTLSSPQQQQQQQMSPQMGNMQHGNNAQMQQRRPPNSAASNQQTQAVMDKRSAQSSIPAYTIGKPKCSGERDDVCYVTFTEAYNTANQQQDSSNHSRQPQQPVFYQQQPVH